MRVDNTDKRLQMPAGVKRGGIVSLRAVGVIRSSIKTRTEAPKQGSEGAPEAWLEVSRFATDALDGLAEGDHIIVVTWLHKARRDVLYLRSPARG
jgi:tRNA (Thr-GGU) A37 N-methylase